MGLCILQCLLPGKGDGLACAGCSVPLLAFTASFPHEAGSGVGDGCIVVLHKLAVGCGGGNGLTTDVGGTTAGTTDADNY